MPSLCRSSTCLPKALTLVAAIVLSATSLHAASSDVGTEPEPAKSPKSVLDVQIPIPHEPDVVNNGCRLRQSPAEPETGALNEVPFWSLIEDKNLTYSVRLTVGDPTRLSAAVDPLDEDARTLALLYVLWNNLGRDGLHTFFYMDRAGSTAPLMRETLQKAGLRREFDIFSRAMALFGEDYPLDPQQRSTFFGWSKPSSRVDAVTTTPAQLSAFDHKLFALSREFGTKATFKATIMTYVNSRPALWRRIEPQRARLNDPDRLTILAHALSDRLGDLWQPYRDVDRRLALMSKQQRALAVMAAFNHVFRNGGVHQFFYDSEGALAPDVLEAMIELGMTEQAAIFKRGLDLFGKPYLRDTELRRESYLHNDAWSDQDKKLSDLTDEFYALNGGLSFHRIHGSTVVEGGPGIDFAMLKYARQHKLLPC
jgi:hypothetical protein